MKKMKQRRLRLGCWVLLGASSQVEQAVSSRTARTGSGRGKKETSSRQSSSSLHEDEQRELDAEEERTEGVEVRTDGSMAKNNERIPSGESEDERDASITVVSSSSTSSSSSRSRSKKTSRGDSEQTRRSLSATDSSFRQGKANVEFPTYGGCAYDAANSDSPAKKISRADDSATNVTTFSYGADAGATCTAGDKPKTPAACLVDSAASPAALTKCKLNDHQGSIHQFCKRASCKSDADATVSDVTECLDVVTPCYDKCVEAYTTCTTLKGTDAAEVPYKTFDSSLFKCTAGNTDLPDRATGGKYNTFDECIRDKWLNHDGCPIGGTRAGAAAAVSLESFAVVDSFATGSPICVGGEEEVPASGIWTVDTLCAYTAKPKKDAAELDGQKTKCVNYFQHCLMPDVLALSVTTAAASGLTMTDSRDDATKTSRVPNTNVHFAEFGMHFFPVRECEAKRHVDADASLQPTCATAKTEWPSVSNTRLVNHITKACDRANYVRDWCTMLLGNTALAGASAGDASKLEKQRGCLTRCEGLAASCFAELPDKPFPSAIKIAQPDGIDETGCKKKWSAFEEQCASGWDSPTTVPVISSMAQIYANRPGSGTSNPDKIRREVCKLATLVENPVAGEDYAYLDKGGGVHEVAYNDTCVEALEACWSDDEIVKGFDLKHDVAASPVLMHSQCKMRHMGLHDACAAKLFHPNGGFLHELPGYKQKKADGSFAASGLKWSSYALLTHMQLTCEAMEMPTTSTCKYDVSTNATKTVTVADTGEIAYQAASGTSCTSDDRQHDAAQCTGDSSNCAFGQEEKLHDVCVRASCISTPSAPQSHLVNCAKVDKGCYDACLNAFNSCRETPGTLAEAAYSTVTSFYGTVDCATPLPFNDSASAPFTTYRKCFEEKWLKLNTCDRAVDTFSRESRAVTDLIERSTFDSMCAGNEPNAGAAKKWTRNSFCQAKSKTGDCATKCETFMEKCYSMSAADNTVIWAEHSLNYFPGVCASARDEYSMDGSDCANAKKAWTDSCDVGAQPTPGTHDVDFMAHSCTRYEHAKDWCERMLGAGFLTDPSGREKQRGCLLRCQNVAQRCFAPVNTSSSDSSQITIAPPVVDVEATVKLSANDDECRNLWASLSSECSSGWKKGHNVVQISSMKEIFHKRFQAANGITHKPDDLRKEVCKLATMVEESVPGQEFAYCQNEHNETEPCHENVCPKMLKECWEDNQFLQAFDLSPAGAPVILHDECHAMFAGDMCHSKLEAFLSTAWKRKEADGQLVGATLQHQAEALVQQIQSRCDEGITKPVDDLTSIVCNAGFNVAGHGGCQTACTSFFDKCFGYKTGVKAFDGTIEELKKEECAASIECQQARDQWSNTACPEANLPPVMQELREKFTSCEGNLTHGQLMKQTTTDSDIRLKVEAIGGVITVTHTPAGAPKKAASVRLKHFHEVNGEMQIIGLNFADPDERHSVTSFEPALFDIDAVDDHGVNLAELGLGNGTVKADMVSAVRMVGSPTNAVGEIGIHVLKLRQAAEIFMGNRAILHCKAGDLVVQAKVSGEWKVCSGTTVCPVSMGGSEGAQELFANGELQLELIGMGSRTQFHQATNLLPHTGAAQAQVSKYPEGADTGVHFYAPDMRIMGKTEDATHVELQGPRNFGDDHLPPTITAIMHPRGAAKERAKPFAGAELRAVFRFTGTSAGDDPLAASVEPMEKIPGAFILAFNRSGVPDLAAVEGVVTGAGLSAMLFAHAISNCIAGGLFAATGSIADVNLDDVVNATPGSSFLTKGSSSSSSSSVLLRRGTKNETARESRGQEASEFKVLISYNLTVDTTNKAVATKGVLPAPGDADLVTKRAYFAGEHLIPLFRQVLSGYKGGEDKIEAKDKTFIDSVTSVVAFDGGAPPPAPGGDEPIAEAAPIAEAQPITEPPVITEAPGGGSGSVAPTDEDETTETTETTAGAEVAEIPAQVNLGLAMSEEEATTIKDTPAFTGIMETAIKKSLPKNDLYQEGSEWPRVKIDSIEVLSAVSSSFLKESRGDSPERRRSGAGTGVASSSDVGRATRTTRSLSERKRASKLLTKVVERSSSVQFAVQYTVSFPAADATSVANDITAAVSSVGGGVADTLSDNVKAATEEAVANNRDLTDEQKAALSNLPTSVEEVVPIEVTTTPLPEVEKSADEEAEGDESGVEAAATSSSSRGLIAGIVLAVLALVGIGAAVLAGQKPPAVEGEPGAEGEVEAPLLQEAPAEGPMEGGFPPGQPTEEFAPEQPAEEVSAAEGEQPAEGQEEGSAAEQAEEAPADQAAEEGSQQEGAAEELGSAQGEEQGSQQPEGSDAGEGSEAPPSSMAAGSDVEGSVSEGSEVEQ
ncbi:unnamed protein product [Amoebophrya sp. A25]|nr:unnamed protein product [Amoebophrya sp. A25]|eukprot:GSA25T00017783001.1